MYTLRTVHESPQPVSFTLVVIALAYMVNKPLCTTPYMFLNVVTLVLGKALEAKEEGGNGNGSRRRLRLVRSLFDEIGDGSSRNLIRR
jgi:hypothetical protein